MVHTISNFAGLSIEAFLNDKVILKSYDESYCERTHVLFRDTIKDLSYVKLKT